MKALKYVGIALFVLLTIVYTLDTFLPPSNKPSVMQTLTFGDRKVHLAQKGDGPVSFNTETTSDGLIVNGRKVELSDGGEFTIVFSADGTYEIKKGAP